MLENVKMLKGKLVMKREINIIFCVRTHLVKIQRNLNFIQIGFVENYNNQAFVLSVSFSPVALSAKIGSL